MNTIHYSYMNKNCPCLILQQGYSSPADLWVSVMCPVFRHMCNVSGLFLVLSLLNLSISLMKPHCLNYNSFLIWLHHGEANPPATFFFRTVLVSSHPPHLQFYGHFRTRLSGLMENQFRYFSWYWFFLFMKIMYSSIYLGLLKCLLVRFYNFFY